MPIFSNPISSAPFAVSAACRSALMRAMVEPHFEKMQENKIQFRLVKLYSLALKKPMALLFVAKDQ
ncbi:hypothetical protein [Pseudomonas sp. BR20]|uniref:hypothetical protein n=1 Tax=Pseudomonas sp. BR20 TaxID=3137452 RepID=UPI003D6F3F70